MTIAELIEELMRHDPEAKVYVRDAEGTDLDDQIILTELSSGHILIN